MKWFAALALSVVLGVTALAARAGAEAADSTGTASFVTHAELTALLEKLEQRTASLKAEAEAARRVKFSGYVQTRFEVGEASSDTVRVGGSPPSASVANLSRFYVRRVRVKLTATPGERARAVVQVDGSQDRTVRVLDAYLTIGDWWTPHRDHQLTLGQFDVPFGYELESSSTARELPERSRAFGLLFNGEQDRGIKLEDRWTPHLATAVAVINGGGVGDPDFPTTDPTRGKDVVGRVRWSRDAAALAVSILRGRDVIPLTGPDVQPDRQRLGADAQWSCTWPRLGKSSFAAELFTGIETNPDSLRALVRTVNVAPGQDARLLRDGADPSHLGTDFTGGYVKWVQDLNPWAQAAVRYDWYDPNTGADHDRYARWGFGLIASVDDHTRFSLAYEAIRTDAPAGAGRFRDPADNLWTFQAQYRF